MLGHKTQSRGLTLTEAAIVLGVVGIVIGAIWVAYAPVQQRQQSIGTANLVWEISKNVRNRYTGQLPPGAPLPTAANLTAANAGIYPNGSTQTPWGGNVTVEFNNRRSFSIKLDGFDTTGNRVLCAELVRLIPGNATTNMGEKSNPVPTTVPTTPPLNQGPSYVFMYVTPSSLVPPPPPAMIWQDETGRTDAVIASDAGSRGCAAISFFYVM